MHYRKNIQKIFFTIFKIFYAKNNLNSINVNQSYYQNFGNDISGRLSFHGISPNETYHIQKEETKPYIARFEKERIPRYMNHFELLLKSNDGGKG